MSSDLAKDRLVTHALTNYLLASLQGKFASLNILSQLQHPDFSEEQVLITQRALSKVSLWNQQLFKDECLFSASWTEPETFEAKDAVQLLEGVRPDLYELSAVLARLLTIQNIPSREEISFLIAAHVRSIYSRDTYLRGFIEYGTVFSIPELVQKYQPLLTETEAEMIQSQELINSLKTAQGPLETADPTFFPKLFQVSMPLPAIFRTHIHDVNQLLSQFKGGLTFTNAEFNQKEAELWSQFNFGPSQAGYWRAYGFSPEEANGWKPLGMNEPQIAIEWKRAGFAPSTATAWVEAQFPLPLAFIWAQAGYTSQEAQEFLKKGVQQPPARKDSQKSNP